jgi:hypothetical protein
MCWISDDVVSTIHIFNRIRIRDTKRYSDESRTRHANNFAHPTNKAYICLIPMLMLSQIIIPKQCIVGYYSKESHSQRHRTHHRPHHIFSSKENRKERKRRRYCYYILPTAFLLLCYTPTSPSLNMPKFVCVGHICGCITFSNPLLLAIWVIQSDGRASRKRGNSKRSTSSWDERCMLGILGTRLYARERNQRDGSNSERWFRKKSPSFVTRDLVEIALSSLFVAWTSRYACTHVVWVVSGEAKRSHCLLISVSCVQNHALFRINESVMIVDAITVAHVVLRCAFVMC